MGRRKRELNKSNIRERKKRERLEEKGLSYQHGKYSHMAKERTLGRQDLADYFNIFNQIAEKIDPSEVNNFKRTFSEPSRDNYKKLKQKYRDVFY